MLRAAIEKHLAPKAETLLRPDISYLKRPPCPIRWIPLTTGGIEGCVRQPNVLNLRASARDPRNLPQPEECLSLRSNQRTVPCVEQHIGNGRCLQGRKKDLDGGCQDRQVDSRFWVGMRGDLLDSSRGCLPLTILRISHQNGLRVSTKVSFIRTNSLLLSKDFVDSSPFESQGVRSSSTVNVPISHRRFFP